MIRKLLLFTLGACAFLVLGVVLAHILLVGGIYAFKSIQSMPAGKVRRSAAKVSIRSSTELQGLESRLIPVSPVKADLDRTADYHAAVAAVRRSGQIIFKRLTAPASPG